MDCNYPSLTILPGTQVDERGNLKFQDEVTQRLDLRARQDRVMAMPVSALTGTVLAELLNWFRWGSATGVMWECTVKELLQLIEHWEEANLYAEIEQYFGSQLKGNLITWDELWTQARAAEASQVRACVCGEVYPYHQRFCTKCRKDSSDGRLTYQTRRGLDTYKTLLIGGDGRSVAVAAFTSRGTQRNIPNLKSVHE